jgi:hypothetical protein
VLVTHPIAALDDVIDDAPTEEIVGGCVATMFETVTVTGADVA